MVSLRLVCPQAYYPRSPFSTPPPRGPPRGVGGPARPLLLRAGLPWYCLTCLPPFGNLLHPLCSLQVVRVRCCLLLEGTMGRVFMPSWWVWVHFSWLPYIVVCCVCVLLSGLSKLSSALSSPLVRGPCISDALRRTPKTARVWHSFTCPSGFTQQPDFPLFKFLTLSKAQGGITWNTCPGS
jgi:hypothetical protein